MNRKKTLYLIDGSSYIFRAFYAIRQLLTNSKGLHTNALYGFVKMLQKIIREKKPDYLAVIFDTGAKTFRHKLYPDYKANRSEPPDELEEQFPYFEPLVKAYNITSIKKEGFEADDIIATLAFKGNEQGLEVAIVSSDKDLMQLVRPGIHMLDTMKNKVFNKVDVIEKFGVPPEQLVDAMALMGDASDNVPGVLGIGPKTAANLIREYGSLEIIFENLERIAKKRLQEKLKKNKNNALLSQKLITLDSRVPLDTDIFSLQYREPNRRQLNSLFYEFEFSSLIEDSRSKPVTSSQTSPPRKYYHTVLTLEVFDSLVNELKKKDAFAVDLETTSPRPMEAKVVGVSISFKEHEAYYIPIDHRYVGAPEQLEKSKVLNTLRPILENPEIKKYGHNIKYDLIVFLNSGVDLKGIAFDSMIASYILNPSKPNHNMDDLAMEYLSHKTITYKDVAGSGVNQIGFEEVAINQATRYAAEDADVTWLFAQKLAPLLKNDDLKLFEDIELPLTEVLAEMEMNGVWIDRAVLQRVSQKIDRELLKYEASIYDLAGEKFTINSPKQLAQILFEKLRLPPAKKTKTGYSTDVSVLEELASQHDLPDKILNYRQLSKLKSTYVEALPKKCNPETGRIHTSFNQSVAATGRLSSSFPNLQNIPIRTEIGREIRQAFATQRDFLLLSADYSQIELRILAHLASDPALIKAFQNDEDIHSRTAAEIFGQPLDQVSDSSRRMAKAVNFGIVYGLSAFGLSRQLKIPPREAKAFIEQYFDLYKNVKTFMDDAISFAREKGYSVTLFNRKRYLPDLNNRNKQIQKAAERIAINSPVQGSAADIIKSAMISLHKELKIQMLQSKMVLQVHDELLFECPSSEKDFMNRLVKKEMEGAFPLKVPLKVDMGWGDNWKEAH